MEEPADTAEGEAEEIPDAAESAEEEAEYVEEEQHILGITKSTDLKADVGDTLMVKPIELTQKDDGSIVWKDAEVVKFLPEEEPDAIEDIRKLVKKRKD